MNSDLKPSPAAGHDPIAQIPAPAEGHCELFKVCTGGEMRKELIEVKPVPGGFRCHGVTFPTFKEAYQRGKYLAAWFAEVPPLTVSGSSRGRGTK